MSSPIDSVRMRIYRIADSIEKMIDSSYGAVDQAKLKNKLEFLNTLIRILEVEIAAEKDLSNEAFEAIRRSYLGRSGIGAGQIAPSGEALS